MKVSLFLFYNSIILRAGAGIYTTYKVLMYECSTPLDYFMNCIAVLYVNDMDETLGGIADKAVKNGEGKLGKPAIAISLFFWFALITSTFTVNVAVGNHMLGACIHPEDENTTENTILLGDICMDGEEMRAGYACRTTPFSELFGGHSYRLCSVAAPLQAARIQDANPGSLSGTNISMSYGLSEGELDIWFWCFIGTYLVLLIPLILLIPCIKVTYFNKKYVDILYNKFKKKNDKEEPNQV